MNEEIRAAAETILDEIPVGLHFYEIDDTGKLIFIGANRAADRILGVDNSRFTGLEITEAFPPLKDTEIPERYLHAAVENSSWHTEQVSYKDKEIEGVFQVRAFGLGKRKMAAAFVDVTSHAKAHYELNRMLKKVEDEKARSVSIIEGMGDGVSIQDLQMHVIYQNEAHKKIIGSHKGSVCFKAYEKRESLCDGCPLALALKDGKAHTSERSADTPDGTVYVEITASPLRNAEGEIIGGIEVVRDITAQKRIEEQLRHAQKMEAIGTLTSGLSHEYNNIMTSIIGYSEFLEETITEDHPGRKFLDMIISSAERAAKLTRGLLAYGRKQPTHMVRLDLSMLVRNAGDILHTMLGSGLELDVETPDEQVFVMADNAQIEQSLVNLIRNAADEMPEGGKVRLLLETISLDRELAEPQTLIPPGRYALLSVYDEGQGIDSGNLKRIFEPFYTTKDVGKGTGLGLSMVYGIVGRHEGYAAADNLEDKGAVFKIYLPLDDSGQVDEPSGREEKTVPKAAEGRTVLIAEDDPAVSVLMRIRLQKQGYNVLMAKNGQEAVDIYKDNIGNVDLLILDVAMPGKTGAQALGEIREIDPEVKALFLSGYSEADGLVKSLMQDGYEFMQKPITSDMLFRKIHNVLGSGLGGSGGRS